MEKVKPSLGASGPLACSLGHPPVSMATTGSYITQGGYPCSAPPLSRAWRWDQPLPRPRPARHGDKTSGRHGLRWPVLADRGEAGRAPPPVESQPRIAEGDADAPRQVPSPEPDPCLSGVSKPCGGVEATGAPRFPKSPSTGFVHTPFRSGSPGDLDVPFPEPTPRSPHRGPCSPGLGGGVPGGEASVRLRRRFTWWHGVGPGASTRAGSGPRRSARGHPAAAERAVPLSLSPGGGAVCRRTGV